MAIKENARNTLVNALRKDAGLGGISELMDGRKKMSMDDFNGQTVTISAVDLADYEDGDKHVHYGVIVTEEYPEYYINGGKATTELVESIFKLAKKTTGKDDLTSINEFVKELELKLKAEKISTKGKRTFTRIEIE